MSAPHQRTVRWKTSNSKTVKHVTPLIEYPTIPGRINLAPLSQDAFIELVNPVGSPFFFAFTYNIWTKRKEKKIKFSTWKLFISLIKIKDEKKNSSFFSFFAFFCFLFQMFSLLNNYFTVLVSTSNQIFLRFLLIIIPCFFFYTYCHHCYFY